eukprot:c29379_g2_i3 orf=445-753(+)
MPVEICSERVLQTLQPQESFYCVQRRCFVFFSPWHMPEARAVPMPAGLLDNKEHQCAVGARKTLGGINCVREHEAERQGQEHSGTCRAICLLLSWVISVVLK